MGLLSFFTRTLRRWAGDPRERKTALSDLDERRTAPDDFGEREAIPADAGDPGSLPVRYAHDCNFLE